MFCRNLYRVCLVGLFLLALTGCRPTSTPTSPSITAAPPATATRPAATAPLPTETALAPGAHLRQAIAHCTDRSALIRSVYPWLTDTAPFEAGSFLRPNHWATLDGDQGLARYPFAPEKGMALLDTLGWKPSGGGPFRSNAQGDTLTLTLTTTESKFRQTWTAVWEEQMQTCGIRILHNAQTAEWLYGPESGLSHRDFELAAFAWSALDELSLAQSFGCDQIPSANNGWQGQNFSGWCNPQVQNALGRLASTFDPAEQKAAYQEIQREFAQDLPMLPLFYRADVYAVNPALDHFLPPEDGIHTWNAARWQISGRDTIVLGSDGEPAGLEESAYIAQVIRTLISGKDAVRIDGVYQPVMLSRVPSFENGLVVEHRVMAKEGDLVVDAEGNPVRLAPGVTVRGAQGEAVRYGGGEIALRQLVVDFVFRPGLTWSDGVPVTQADYELGYRVHCAAANPDAGSACKVISQVTFLGDSRYQVRWMPGYAGASAGEYFLPPFRREPAHQVLADGRTLAEVPAAQWLSLPEVRLTPLGAGPYVLKEWVYGEKIALEANPFYFDGPVATPRILVRFLEHPRAISALVDGDVDILDVETIGPPDVEDFHLAQAHEEGKITLVLIPSPIWEQITFRLGD